MTVRVDLAGLTEAFEDASAELGYFVDRETGEVILVSDTLGFIEAGQQRIEMAKSPGRYLPVPVSGLNEFTEDLESFVDALSDETLRAALEDVLDAADPRKALDVYLAKHEDLALEWSRHRTTRFLVRAGDWLKENGFHPA